MKKEKMQELFKDEKFVEALAGAQSPEAVQALFANNGLELTIDEIMTLKAQLKQEAGEELDDDELALVAGGVTIIGSLEGGGEVVTAVYEAAKDAIYTVGGGIKKIFTSKW